MAGVEECLGSMRRQNHVMWTLTIVVKAQVAEVEECLGSMRIQNQCNVGTYGSGEGFRPTLIESLRQP